MVRWEGEAMVLSVRRHGESAALLDVLTSDAGRLAGIVRGGAGRKLGPVLQPGAALAVRWHARLDTHLGTFSAEALHQPMAGIMDDPVALGGLASLCAVLSRCLPEKVPMPGLLASSLATLEVMQRPGWAEDYVLWEVNLLTTLGFGLDLLRCAVTGSDADLRFVSPRTGRAVSAQGAIGWEDRLLRLPPFLARQGIGATGADISDGLRLTGHFLREHALRDRDNGQLPDARVRLQEMFEIQRAGLRRPSAI
jgi:DNA repair protein RecO (recombination protein O)